MIDIEHESDEDHRYECFDCGRIVVAESAVACPECGGELRNRKIPVE